jgi:hypothetical protein
MRKFTSYVTIISLGLMMFHANAQVRRHCGTMDYLDKQLAADPSLKQRMREMEEMTQEIEKQTAGMRNSEVVITIPVVFHLLYYNNAQNISDNRIFDQLNTLNKDYSRQNLDTANTPAAFKPFGANTNVQFCLAHTDTNGNYTSGIIRKQCTVTGFDPLSNDNVKYTLNGGDDNWDHTKYLNVWICNFTGVSASNGLLGIAQFPNMGSIHTDGVVIKYTTVGGTTFQGTENSFKLGRTATHEIGHWLNLYHIWGDDFMPNQCTGSDYVTDTPNQDHENYGCVSFPHVSCSNGPNGDMFSNYMDYGDDVCLNIFTTGQKNRMNAALNSSRVAIQSSTKCNDATAISNPSGQIQFSIYPNPSTGEFVVSSQLNESSDAIVRVSNMLGEIVFSQEYKNVPYLVQTINLSSRTNGIYIVEIRTAKGSSTGKLVLNK